MAKVGYHRKLRSHIGLRRMILLHVSPDVGVRYFEVFSRYSHCVSCKKWIHARGARACAFCGSPLCDNCVIPMFIEDEDDQDWPNRNQVIEANACQTCYEEVEIE